MLQVEVELVQWALILCHCNCLLVAVECLIKETQQFLSQFLAETGKLNQIFTKSKRVERDMRRKRFLVLLQVGVFVLKLNDQILEDLLVCLSEQVQVVELHLGTNEQGSLD